MTAPTAADPFFRSHWVTPPAGVVEHPASRLAPGFRAGTASAGLKGEGRTDVGLLLCESADPRSAILLTANASAAAPVRVCRDRCEQDSIAAAVVNSGNANASTGEAGMRDAIAMQARAAAELSLPERAVAVAETGVIGVPLPIEAILDGIGEAASAMDPDAGEQFSDAIMTTDRWPKTCTLSCDGVTLSAQAKGAGMIEPGFATMLCFVQTDAVLTDPSAELRRASAASFERITVDGQMSTNDTVLLQASGLSGKPLPEGLLDAVLLQLALEVVLDGEGATRAGRIEVTGAADSGEAERVAREIANSPLVKTALFGRDPNWGRIAQAAGKALAGEELPELGPDRIDATALAGEAVEAEIGIELGRGEASTHLYFSDLTYKYIEINAEYTT